MSSAKESLKYCVSLFQYRRRVPSEVTVGNLIIGGDYPIRIQSMTTTNTLDTDQTVNQSKRIIDKGGELVRMTTQGRREASNLKQIKDRLVAEGYTAPLVADIHFNPNAAEIAATLVEKVRINPGNFADGAKKFREIDYTEKSWHDELQHVESKLLPFLELCKKHHTAIRIGTNHGSLSDRIMSRYGDTPEGMVESCMEYLRICEKHDFTQIVLSIKASNTRIMVHTVRLLIAKMNLEGMQFPLHLGVTEAGDGEDGRMKSAVGIGALLLDGIGDTIRVSLTEEPENEIDVAKALIDHVAQYQKGKDIEVVENNRFTPFEYNRRETHETLNIGGNQTPIVIQQFTNLANYHAGGMFKADYLFCESSNQIDLLPSDTHIICPVDIFHLFTKFKNCYPSYQSDSYAQREPSSINFLKVGLDDMTDDLIGELKKSPTTVIIASSEQINGTYEMRAMIWKLQNAEITNPIIIQRDYADDDLALFQLKSSVDNGVLFLDGMADGIFIRNKQLDDLKVLSTQFNILQSSRVRFSKTDYISCPGCGRTLFALQEVTAAIKERTSHLKNLKIGIMGCIVNGIGEMADADYGYIGSGPDRISLYNKKNIVKKNIPIHLAIDELISLIKEQGDWVEP